MPRVSLTGGDYRARALIANAQSCINLYGEPNPEDSPAPFTYYQTSGLRYFFEPYAANGVTRCLYTASNGLYFGVIGEGVYLLNGPAPGAAAGAQNQSVLIGVITPGTTMVTMQDNGIVVVIVDGSANGWYFPILPAANSLIEISDPAFYGSNSIGYLDTFLIFNRPGTNQWYVSPSNYAGNTTPFDALYIAAKTTDPDIVSAVAVVGQIIWIIGIYNIELWYDSGAADFPFQRVSGVSINSGCITSNTIEVNNGAIFWLGRSQHGARVVMTGAEYQTEVISTRAIEHTLENYQTISDAYGLIYQQGGHTFYVITFPSADQTWAYDVTAQIWHQRTSLGSDGLQHAWRPTALSLVDDEILAGDAQTSCIYSLDQNVYADDNGPTIGAFPITRTRDFPHMMTDGRRGVFRQFTIDMTTGTNQTVTVAMSADRGNTYSAPIGLSTGSTPDTYPTLWRLGISRDVVFRVSWSFPAETALNGAFLTLDPLRS